MPLNWTTTDQSSVNQGVKVLVYGPAGVGKTVLCSTAPEPMIISAESGLLSLRKFRIPAVEVHTMQDLMEAYTWVAQSQEARRFFTICLDSMSEIAEVVLAHLIKTKGQNDPRKAYGELIPQVTTMIRAFRDLPGKNVYFAAKQEPFKDDMSGIVKYGPSMPGQKLGPQIPFFFDEVFALRIGVTEKKESYRYLQTQPDMQFDAKDRSGSLSQMEPPNLTHIFQKILSA